MSFFVMVNYFTNDGYSYTDAKSYVHLLLTKGYYEYCGSTFDDIEICGQEVLILEINVSRNNTFILLTIFLMDYSPSFWSF
mgnify:CR=1 FL=1